MLHDTTSSRVAAPQITQRWQAWVLRGSSPFLRQKGLMRHAAVHPTRGTPATQQCKVGGFLMGPTNHTGHHTGRHAALVHQQLLGQQQAATHKCGGGRARCNASLRTESSSPLPVNCVELPLLTLRGKGQKHFTNGRRWQGVHAQQHAVQQHHQQQQPAPTSQPALLHPVIPC